MPLVNPTLPNDGESADAIDVSGPFLELLAIFNGHIGADNLEPGTIAAGIGDGEIDEDMLENGVIATAKLADYSVTPVKVAQATTAASGATTTPVVASRMHIITALAEGTTVAVPTGTPQDGQGMVLRFKDNGTARSIAWNAIYRAIGVTLPTATVANKMLYVTMAYNAAATKWDVLSVAREA